MIAQCVQFCPRPIATTAVDVHVTAQPATGPVVRSAMAQGCAISIYADPDFGGINSEVTSDQPQLSQFGWGRSISSIDVRSGTWDLYTEVQFGGLTIRLTPGRYPVLDPVWDKQINSLMCVQP